MPMRRTCQRPLHAPVTENTRSAHVEARDSSRQDQSILSFLLLCMFILLVTWGASVVFSSLLAELGRYTIVDFCHAISGATH